MKIKSQRTTKLVRTIRKAAKSKSPEIKLIAGLAGIAVATVMYCKAAVKAEDVKKDFTKQHDTVLAMKEAVKAGDTVTRREEGKEEEVIDMTAIRREMGLTYSKAALGFLKCYALPVGIQLVSIALIVMSHKELRGINAALNAALSSSMAAYNKLRNDIRERYGPEVENELVNGITSHEVTTTTTDADGNTVETKKTVSEWNGELGPNCVEFSRLTNDNWDPNPEYNKMFIASKMKSLELKLETEGSVDKVEALSALSYDLHGLKTQEAKSVGWLYDEENDTGYIDYKVHEVQKFDPDLNTTVTNYIIEFIVVPLYEDTRA